MGGRGAPVGNKNAVTHGFYAEVLTERQKMELEEAGEMGGLDAELALLRFQLRHLLKNNPDRTDLHLQAVGMITRLIRTRYATTPPGREKLKAAIHNVLTEVAIPLGLKYIPRNNEPFKKTSIKRCRIHPAGGTGGVPQFQNSPKNGI